MSETIDRMLAEARARAKAPTRPWWGRITKEDVPRILEDAIATIWPGGHRGVANEKLFEIMSWVYNWRYFEAFARQNERDPLQAIVKDLREEMSVRF